jgi:hypothetical protein
MLFSFLLRLLFFHFIPKNRSFLIIPHSSNRIFALLLINVFNCLSRWIQNAFRKYGYKLNYKFVYLMRLIIYPHGSKLPL